MATTNLLKSLVNKDTLKEIGKIAGVDSNDVSSVLVSALPSLLQGANKQTSSKTSESFVSALADHANSDTSNLSSFFKNIDLDDGAKIVTHLIGNNTTASKKIAKETGVDASSVIKILSAAAPLFMSLLGKQTKANSKKADTSSTLNLASQLLGNVDIAGIAGSFLGANKKTDNKIDANDVVNLIGKFIK